MKPSELLDHLWRHGVSADDREALSAARDAAPPAHEDGDDGDDGAASGLGLFAAWLLAGDGGVTDGVDPAALSDPALRVLARAVSLRIARLRRDFPAMDAEMAAIDEDLGDLDPGDLRGTTVRSAVDLALAEAALLGGDVIAARRCLTRVAASGPPAFRIAALLQQVSVLVARADLPTALTRARQAERLADQLGRALQGQQAHLLLGLVAYAMSDADALRTALAPLADSPHAATARVLLASMDASDQVPPIASAGLQIAAERRDPLGYAICSLVGGRCQARSGRLIDALVTAFTARRRLLDVAPDLVVAIDGEVDAWRRTWGDDAFRAAEAEAVAALDRR